MNDPTREEHQKQQQPSLAGSKSRLLTGVALFSAVAIILNVSHVQFSAPYLPFLYYNLWEIPIVVVLLLYGFYAGVFAAAINTGALLLVNPGASPAGPLYNLIAVIVTLASVLAAQRVANRASGNSFAIIASATALAMLARSAVLTIVNYALLPLSPPIGLNIPDSAVVPLLPLIAFFNATLVLYTVPIGYAIVRAVSSRTRFRIAHPLPSYTGKMKEEAENKIQRA